MPLQINKTLILAEIETTYGTDSTPVGADALEVESLDFQPLQADTVTRNVIDGKLGSSAAVRVRKSVTLSFSVAFQSSGSAGTAPAWGKLMRGCGFSEAIQTGTQVQYSPVDSNWESLTFYVYDSGQTLHRIVGARGSFSINLTANENPTIDFTFTGLPSAISATTAPTANNSNWQNPITPNSQNTPTATIDGYAGSVASLSLDIANQVNLRDLIGTRSVEITDRAPTGSMTFDMPDLTDKDFYQLVDDEQLTNLSIVHGVTAGQIIELSAPKVQLSSLNRGDDNGIAQFTAEMLVIAENGNDEIIITSK